MEKNIFNKNEFKINLHTHTNNSDGRVTPEESAKIYKEAGYDAIAITDHWFYGNEQELNGLLIISGAEYNVGGAYAQNGVYHIIGIGMKFDPISLLTKEEITESESRKSFEIANSVISAIHKAGGLAILGHPSWSVNTPEQIKKLVGVDATEIYNSVSNVGQSNRPYSGDIVDMLATEGIEFPLLATDDTHYYEEDACLSYIMVECENLNSDEIIKAIKEKRFYASQGPKLNIYRDDDGTFNLKCSPVKQITFMTNKVWDGHKLIRGENLTEASYKPDQNERFLRVEIIDNNGKYAWSNVYIL